MTGQYEKGCCWPVVRATITEQQEDFRGWFLQVRGDDYGSYYMTATEAYRALDERLAVAGFEGEVQIEWKTISRYGAAAADAITQRHLGSE